ncbi:MAG: SDR family NAD(P)-dependent oxidoreductase [Burkholderiaceae bacterium]
MPRPRRIGAPLQGDPIGRIGRKVSLVTGAASGIGRETSRLFTAEGARVAVVDRDNGGAGNGQRDTARRG